MEVFPLENETSGVTPKENGVSGADGWGRGGDGNYPSTIDTEEGVNDSHGEEMASSQEPEVPHIPQRVRADGGRGDVRPHRHPDGAYGARLSHRALARCEYRLLASVEPTGDLAAAEPQGSGDSPKYTS